MLSLHIKHMALFQLPGAQLQPQVGAQSDSCSAAWVAVGRCFALPAVLQPQVNCAVFGEKKLSANKPFEETQDGTLLSSSVVGPEE